MNGSIELETNLINGNSFKNKHCNGYYLYKLLWCVILMGTMKIKKLKETYEFSCNEYVQKFCNKQEMTNEGWVNDDVGGIALCSDFYFNLHDIVWDINSKQPKGEIIDWYYENLDTPEKAINYYSYTKGLRIADIS